MSRYWDEEEDNIRLAVVIRDTCTASALFIAMCMAGCPHYNVWQQGLAGKAALARAEQDRQIAIKEAQAKLESATMLADAEVARAKGVREANQIIAAGLGGPEGYLRYLYVQGLTDHAGKSGTVIYVPTEAGLPILEAGKRQAIPGVTQ